MTHHEPLKTSKEHNLWQHILSQRTTMFRFSFLTLIFFCLSYFIYFSHGLSNVFSVELIHRDSSKSPIYHPIKTKFQRVYNVVNRSINRVNHFSKQFSLNTNQPVSTLMPDEDSREYIISYSVGTPPSKTYVGLEMS